MAKIEIDQQIAEFLTLHYSDNSNKDLAANLNIIVNADSKNGKEGSGKTVTIRDVKLYANQLGLKKSQNLASKATRRKVIRERVERSHADLSFFSGDPMSDIKLAEDGNMHVIVCENINQVKALQKAAIKYNTRQSSQSGYRVNLLCETDRFTVLVEPERIFQSDSCRTRSFRSKDLYAPP